MPSVLFQGGSGVELSPHAMTWLKRHKEWSVGGDEGCVLLSRIYPFDDDVLAAQFRLRLTELVTDEQGRDLRILEAASLQIGLVSQNGIDATLLRDAEECDTLFQEMCEDGTHDPYAKPAPDDPEVLNDEDDDWD